MVQMRQMEEINMEYLSSIMRKPISKRKQTFEMLVDQENAL